MEPDKLVVTEAVGKSYKEYLLELVEFINEIVDEKALLEDLNALVQANQIQFVKRDLKIELIAMLKDEIVRQTQ